MPDAGTGFTFLAILLTSFTAPTANAGTYEPPSSIMSDDGTYENVHMGQSGAYPLENVYGTSSAGGGNNIIIGSTAMNAGNLKMVTQTLDRGAGVATLYLNNFVTGSQSGYSGLSATTAGFRFAGRGGVAGSGWTGDLFEWMIFNRPLTSAEVSQEWTYAQAVY